MLSINQTDYTQAQVAVSDAKCILQGQMQREEAKGAVKRHKKLMYDSMCTIPRVLLKLHMTDAFWQPNQSRLGVD